MIETHPKPLESKSDPHQAVRPDALNEFLRDVMMIRKGPSVDRDNSPTYYS